MLIPETVIISGASLATERQKRHEKGEIIPCAQNELMIKIATGGALSSLERALVLKAQNVSMAVWEWIGIGTIGDSKTEKTAI
jgi:hypothetical protein